MWSINMTDEPPKINILSIAPNVAQGPSERAWIIHYPWAIGALQVVSELVCHLGSDPRRVLRHVVVHNEDVALCE